MLLSIGVFRLKEKKVLEQSIAKLRTMNHGDDDEIKRQLYTEQIKWWIQQAEDDITALKGRISLCLDERSMTIDSFLLPDEVKLLQFSKEPFEPVNLPSSQPPSTNVLPVNQTFTLVTTKDRLYKEAIGKGYPR